jgi:tRNA pseudouridine55 synthase
MTGLIVIDKPCGLTSREVVNRIQRFIPKRMKIGHTGTLDPLATGVMVICIGAATKFADRVQSLGKCYESRFRLGCTSNTDDAEGLIEPWPDCQPPTESQVREQFGRFHGEISQLPPAFSALKVGGKRAHEIARAGQEVVLQPRIVHVQSMTLLQYEWPFVDVRIDCGKGTYVRSIARDLGEQLRCGGLVDTLRRTRVGPFTAEQSLKLADTSVAIRLLPRTNASDRRTCAFIRGNSFLLCLQLQQVRSQRC